MQTLLLSMVLAIMSTLSAHAAEIAHAPFFHCAQWDNVSVGQACFKAAYDQCGLGVALAEQAECIAGFNALPAEQRDNPSLAAEYCTELLRGLTKDALCPTPLPACNDPQRTLFEPCQRRSSRH